MAVAAPGVRVTRLQDQTFTSGATVSIQTAGQLPPGRLVYGVHFRLDLDATQPGAGQAAQLGAVLAQLIAQVKIGRRVSITGLGMRALDWMQRGGAFNLPAGFPATASAVFSRGIEWSINYIDPTSQSPDDGAIPSDMWQDPVEVRFGTNAIFAATAPTLGNGILRTYVVHGPARGHIIPSSFNIQSEDFSALLATINKPGKYVYAVLYREASNDAGGITSAQVSNFTSYIDGEPLLNNLRSQDAAMLFNRIRATGTNVETESQTDPRAGESLNTQPGVAAAAGQAVTGNYLPLVFPPNNFLLSHVPTANIGTKYEFSGTLTSYKIAYRLVEARAEAAVARAAARLGVRRARVEVKSKSKAGVHPDDSLARYLPLRVDEE